MKTLQMPNFASTWLKVALSAGGQLLLSSLWGSFLQPPCYQNLVMETHYKDPGSECTLREACAGSAGYGSYCKGGVRCSAHLRE